MKRYKIIIEYDGTGFSGWQKQKDDLSIQALIEGAVFKLSSEETVVYGAGRTDAGVHALNQTAHFDLEKLYPLKQIAGAINHYLKPYPIIIKEIEEVHRAFHARFSAKSRSYIYQIMNRPVAPALFRDYYYHVVETLDIKSMNDAAQVLVGKHDLSSFRSSACQSRQVIKTIDEISIKQNEQGLIVMYIKAPSFLHNQVRIIMGCLLEVGRGKWSKLSLQNVLIAKDRTKAAKTAPPHGLYLYEVEY